jgi:hypothetical protein
MFDFLIILIWFIIGGNVLPQPAEPIVMRPNLHVDGA